MLLHKIAIFAVATLVISIIGILNHDAYATRYEIKDKDSCQSLSETSSWNSTTNVCIITGASLTFDDSFTIKNGIILVLNGSSITNNGAITNHGTINIGQAIKSGIAGGSIINHGTITNYGIITIGTVNKSLGGDGSIDNNGGTIENHGTINVIGNVYNNYGKFNNFDTINIGSNTIRGPDSISNSDTFNNYGVIVIFYPGGLVNLGTLNNKGTIQNDGFIGNYDVINNFNIINNAEAFTNYCGATANNFGTLSDNPINNITC